jgi:membrane protein
MADPDLPDPLEPTPLEIEGEPAVAGRLARWTERARVLGTRVEAARARHASVDLALTVVERDSTIGGGMLAGALAYRLFVFLLPTAVLFVSGLGLYAASVDKSTTEVAEEAGLHGLIASEVSTACGVH